MSRKPNLVSNENLHLTLDPKLKQRLDLILYSEAAERILKGAYKEFFEARLREWLEWKKLSLEVYGFPPGYFVAGPQDMIEALITRLEKV